MFRSSAFMLSVGFVLLATIALGLFAVPLWYAWQVTVESARIEVLKEDTEHLTSVFKRRGADGLAKFIDERIDLQIANEGMLLLGDASLTPLAGNLPEWPRNISKEPGTSTISISLDGRPARALFMHTQLPGGYNLLVGRDLRLRPLETRFWFGLAAALVVLMIAGLFSGILLRRAWLARIEKFNQTAAKITQGELSHRLQTSSHGDEFNTLSRIINGMLDQIEQLVHGVRNVSNSIAHDLRTPLTELRFRLEEMAVTHSSDHETLAEIEAAIADVDRVIEIFSAILRLAEIEAGASRSNVVEVDAAEAAAKAVEFYQPFAEQKGIRLILDQKEAAPILGDSVLLIQAIGNLIDNAVKFAPENGAVGIGTRRMRDGAVEITVSDNGPGIPDPEKPRVVERFYRRDGSRGTPGVGLGLSLVRAVAKLHLGYLELVDNHPGLRARIVISGIV